MRGRSNGIPVVAIALGGSSWGEKLWKEWRSRDAGGVGYVC